MFGFVVEFVEVFFSTSSQSIKARVYDHLGLFNPPVNQQLLAFHCKIFEAFMFDLDQSTLLDAVLSFCLLFFHPWHLWLK